MSQLISAVTVISLLVTAVYAVGSYLAASFLGKTVSKLEKWIIAWLIFDALIHFTLEGPFVVISLTGTVQDSTHFTALLWQEYGKADSRWLVSDPTIVSLEILTVVVTGCLAVVLVEAIINDKYYRHFVQIGLCTCELYGGWMTFCPDWLLGSPSLVTDNFLYMWVYLVFFNILWVVIPVGLLYHSFLEMKESSSLKPSTTVSRKIAYTTTQRKYNLRSKRLD